MDDEIAVPAEDLLKFPLETILLKTIAEQQIVKDGKLEILEKDLVELSSGKIICIYLTGIDLKSANWFKLYPNFERDSILFGTFKEAFAGTHPIIKIGSEIFEKIGGGVRDYDECVEIHSPYRINPILKETSFGKINGAIHSLRVPLEMRHLPGSFSIYFVPDRIFLGEMKSKIKDPEKEHYFFRDSDLNKANIDSATLSSKTPSTVNLSYENAYINML